MDAFASFRVSVDHSKQTWNLKASKCETLELSSERRQYKRHKSLSASSNHIPLANSVTSRNFHNSMHNLYQTYNDNQIGLSSSFNSNLLSVADPSERVRRESLQEIRHRTMSTSYLNEEDDYDNDGSSSYVKDHLRKFRNQMNITEGGHQESGQENVDAQNPESNRSPESSSSSSEDSDGSESDEYANLYSIDEYDESLQTADCDPGKLGGHFEHFYCQKVNL